jgi:hypothetical protein
MVASGRVLREAFAVDADSAYEILRDMAPCHFGFLTIATPKGSTEKGIPVRTSVLFARWGNYAAARAIIEAVIDAGGTDTSFDLPERERRHRTAPPGRIV